MEARLLRNGPIVWTVYFCVLCALSFLSFGQLTDLPVVNADDFHYLTQSARVSRDFSALLDPDYHGPRPLADLVFWVGFEFWGDEAKWFHLLVICCFTIACFLLALLCREMALPLEESFLAGLFFLTSVAHFRNLCLIAGLSYHLALILVFTAVFLYLRDESRRSWKRSAGFTCAIILGVLSHPAVAFVLLFCLFTTYNRGQNVRAALVRLAPASLAAAVVVFCLAFFFPDKIQTYHSLQIPPLRLLAGHFFWFWSRLATTAHWVLLPLYEYQDWELIIGGIVFLAFLFLLLRCRGRSEAEWAFWTCVSLLPFVNRLPRSLEIGTSGPSHYLYFAGVGASVLLARALLRSRDWIGKRAGCGLGLVVYGVLVGAILLCSISTFGRLQAFSLYSSGKFHLERRDLQTGIELLQRALDVDGSARIIPREKVYIALCHGLMLRGEDAGALLRQGMKQFPHSSELLAVYGATESVAASSAESTRGLDKIEIARQDMINTGKQDDFKLVMATTYQYLAEGFNVQGQGEKSIQASQRSLQYKSDNARTYFNLGVSHARLGRPQEAIEFYEEALRLDAGISEIYFNLGLAYGELGRYGDGVKAFEQAVRMMPENSVAFLKLGFMRTAVGQWEMALAAFAQAVRLYPGYVDAHYNMGAIYFKMGDFSRAAESFGRLLEVEPGNVDALMMLGAAYTGSGNHRTAVDAYRRAVQLRPSAAAAHLKLVVAYLQIGDERSAREHFRILAQLDRNLADQVAELFE